MGVLLINVFWLEIDLSNDLSNWGGGGGGGVGGGAGRGLGDLWGGGCVLEWGGNWRNWVNC